MSKPRLKYAAFAASQKPTVRQLIDRLVSESHAPGARAFGESKLCSLGILQRSPIGEKVAAELKVNDFIEHCRERRAEVSAATVGHDMTYMRVVLLEAKTAWEIPGVTLEAYDKAKHLLTQRNTIGKANVRYQRPTQEQIDALNAWCDKHAAHWRTKLPMRTLIEFAILSTRRISETCRLKWADLDMEKRTCWVRDLKNPKGKGEHGEFPLLGRAWDIVMAQPRVSDRIFPYNSKSVSVCFRTATQALGIEDLHLHDLRREGISRLFEQGYSVPEVAKVSLHKNPTLLLKVYTALKPEDLHRGPSSKRQSAPAEMRMAA